MKKQRKNKMQIYTDEEQSKRNHPSERVSLWKVYESSLSEQEKRRIRKQLVLLENSEKIARIYDFLLWDEFLKIENNIYKGLIEVCKKDPSQKFFVDVGEINTINYVEIYCLVARERIMRRHGVPKL